MSSNQQGGPNSGTTYQIYLGHRLFLERELVRQSQRAVMSSQNTQTKLALGITIQYDLSAPLTSPCFEDAESDNPISRQAYFPAHWRNERGDKLGADLVRDYSSRTVRFPGINCLL
jgi:hypothetical protein